MGLRINTNVASISAQRQLATNSQRLEHSQQALASGKRIVTAADDAAGLSIAENIRGQLGGIKMARNNAFNAQSVFQIAEGGLNEISNILIRLRELGVQAASDTVSEVERDFLNTEAQQLLAESQRISVATRFGNKQLLAGEEQEMEFHVGPFADYDQNVIAATIDADATNDTLGIDGLDVSDKDGARDTLQAVDDAIVQIGKMRSDFGAVQSRMQSTVRNLDVANENLSAAQSRIMDADIARETSEMYSARILQSAAVATLAQANQNGASALQLIG